MCGFAGFIDFQYQSTEDILQSMTNAISYRGPDDAGYSLLEDIHAQIGLGHRRLSIIDLSPTGHQPMNYNHLSIVFNGEIYNYKEIREELALKHNRQFNSQSDTEVILHAYDVWGIDCIKRFNGMFAIVLFDKRAHKIILIRDRAGVKPFYVYNNSNTILFSSELKSFHQHPAFKKELNQNALSLFLQYGYIPAPYTIFNDAIKVLPGSYLEIDLATKKIEQTIYWDVLNYYNEPKLDISENEAILETEKLLISACNYRMVSDVPVGVFLSGGYDSSCVAAILQHNRTEKINTFTIGFDDSNYNEAEYAKVVAQRLGTNHTEYYCNEQDAKDILPDLPFIFDEPFGDSSAIPTILVSKIAKKSVTVALSADGGDEIFAGYKRYTNIEQNYLTLKKIPKVLRGPIGHFMSFTNPNNLLRKTGKYRADFVYDSVANIFKNGLTAANINKYSSQRIPINKINSLLKKSVIELHTFFDDEILLNSSNTQISKLLALDYKTYMVDDILTKVDRATMSVSLEGREPLLDYRLIEFVSKLPISFKLKGDVKKHILKEITHKYIPIEIMSRPKMGFGIPLVNWFRNDLKYYLTTYLNSERIEKQGLFETKYVNVLVDRYLKGANDDFELIWFMLMFQMWYDQWM